MSGDAFGLTPELLTHVRKEEAFVGHPYRDPVGLPTIGYGERIPSMEWPAWVRDRPMSIAQGLERLQKDLAFYRDAGAILSPGLYHEPEPRMAAITDLCFNAGIGTYKKSDLRKQVNAGQWAAAAANMRTWCHAHKPDGTLIILDDLKRRRATTAYWLETGTWA